MPNIKSAKKELRKGKKRHAYNVAIMTDLKTVLKKSRQALAANDPKAAELVKNALKKLDKAAQKGVIKTNNRNRKKSRLQSKLNKSLKK